MSTDNHEKIDKLFNILEKVDKTELERYYKWRKEGLSENREVFPLTIETIDDLKDKSLYETIIHDREPYKHAMTNNSYISRRLSDGKFFKWGYTTDYNSGLCDWSLDCVEEVFPITKIVTYYQ